MMTRRNIEESIKEARRYIVTAQAALERLNAEKESPQRLALRTPDDYSYGSPETGALRRHSMDLTRKLAELRKP